MKNFNEIYESFYPYVYAFSIHPCFWFFSCMPWASVSIVAHPVHQLYIIFDFIINLSHLKTQKQMFERKRSCIFCLKPALGGDRFPVFGLCFQGHSCVTPGQSKVSRVLLCTSSRPALQESAQSSFRKLSGIRLWLQLNCNHVKYPNFVILLLERINVSSLRSHILINRERLCEQN